MCSFSYLALSLIIIIIIIIIITFFVHFVMRII